MIKVARLPYGSPLYKSPSALCATWFGSGLISPASGTWGTLAAMPLAVFFARHGIDMLCLWAVIFFCIGLWAAGEYEYFSGEHDSKHVVIDEVAGIFIAAIPLAIWFSWDMALMVFLLFRLFDACKIGIVGWFDKNVSGALGVMLDDVAAGFLTACVILAGMLWI